VLHKSSRPAIKLRGNLTTQITSVQQHGLPG